MKYIVLILFALLIGYFLIPDCVSEYQKETEVIVNRPYNMVLMNLSKQDLLYKIIESQNGAVLKKTNDKAQLDIHKIIKLEWTLNSTNYYTIKTNIKISTELDLTQTVHATNNKTNIVVTLTNPNTHIIDLKNYITIEPFGKEQTKIVFSNYLKYKCKAPVSYHTNIHKEVEFQCNNNLKHTIEIIATQAETKTLFSIPVGTRK